MDADLERLFVGGHNPSCCSRIFELLLQFKFSEVQCTLLGTSITLQSALHRAQLPAGPWMNCIVSHCGPDGVHCTLYTPLLHCTTLYYTALHYTSIHYTALHLTLPHELHSSLLLIIALLQTGCTFTG